MLVKMLLEFDNTLANGVAAIMHVRTVLVRGDNDGSNSVRHGDLCHGERLFERLGTIVNGGDQVAVDIDKIRIGPHDDTYTLKDNQLDARIKTWAEFDETAASSRRPSLLRGRAGNCAAEYSRGLGCVKRNSRLASPLAAMRLTR